MKISKIIEELTELKEIIGDREVEGCMANSAVTSVNILYLNDEGGFTSTCLEGEKLKAKMNVAMNDLEPLNEIKVKILRFVRCKTSNDLDLVATAIVEVTDGTSFLGVKDIGLMHNGIPGKFGIFELSSSGMHLNETCRIAVTNALTKCYTQTERSD